MKKIIFTDLYYFLELVHLSQTNKFHRLRQLLVSFQPFFIFLLEFYIKKVSVSESSQKQCDILEFIKFVVFGKNSIRHPKISKCRGNFDMLGNMLITMNTETFFQINVAKIAVTCRNEGIPRNWHIFVSSAVKTLIFHILPPKTCSLDIYKKALKIWKIVVCFEVTSSRNIFLQKN